jgi:fermentation-respiration switch protein FrsA (DUF1100 family)
MTQMTSPDQSPQPRIRIGRIIRLLLFLIVLLLTCIPFGLGYSFIAVLTVSGCDGDVDPLGWGMAREDITFPSSEFDQPYVGYFIPGTRAATVIVAPTLRAGRGDRIEEIQVYHEAGYNVLTYRARTCFGARHSLGYAEATGIGDALTYLQTRSDIDPEQIAVHGFSAGGAAALIAFGRYPELRAAVASGGYHDFDTMLDTEIEQLGNLSFLFDAGARLSYQMLLGNTIETLSPLKGVNDSAPRPILLVYGSTEVSLAGAEVVQATAPDRVRLWVVPNAGHGNYVYMAGEETYSQEVIGWLDGVIVEAR